MKNIEKQNSNTAESKHKVTLLIILLVLILVIIILMQIGYSKYIQTAEIKTSAKVAEMICTMEVEPSGQDRTIINPYCMVTVKNFNANDEITETDVAYKIQVTPKENFEIPEYYWEDSNGTIVARTTEVTGSLKNGTKKADEYKIVFLNTGEQDITRLVEFNLIAEQAM